jgi:outer membrane protein OmpA-like peptidoglycan-associated protein
MKKFIGLVSCIAVLALVLSCAQEQVKEQPKVATDNTFVPVSNSQLSKFPVTGFAYKSSKLPAQEWDRWAVAAAPVVKGIVNKIPDGYALEVRGHADSRGPEGPEGDKPGNLKISTDRAKAVYDSLAKAGIKSNKITYRGVGSSEPTPNADQASAKQRRVTFVIVPK